MKHRRCKLIKPHHYGPLQPPLITSAMPLGSSLALELIRKQVCAKYGPSSGSLLSEAAMEELIKNVGDFLEGERKNGQNTDY